MLSISRPVAYQFSSRDSSRLIRYMMYADLLSIKSSTESIAEWSEHGDNDVARPRGVTSGLTKVCR